MNALKWFRERLPWLNRRQRVIRNLAMSLLCLLLLDWMLGFPALSKRALLREAEQQYLLEGSELLFTTTTGKYGFDAPHTLYARNGDLLLTVNYNWTPLGLQPAPARLWQEPDGIRLSQGFMGIAGSYMAFGSLEGAASAELSVTLAGKLEVYDNEQSLGYRTYRETYTARGQRQNPYCFTFQLEPHHAKEQILDDHWAAVEEQTSLYTPFGALLAQDAVLRLYDEAGELYHEKTVPWPEWDHVYWE